MTEFRRRAMVATLVMSLVASVMQLEPARAADEGTASTPTGQSLVVPDVPEQQPVLTMACADGQIDLNHAPIDDLLGLPDINVPIARRVIESRPHDRVEDLLVVQGIGPGKLERIIASGLGCSTPLTIPPPSDDACVGDQADVNDPASEPVLAELFGGPTAARIVEAQPFPDLDHAVVVAAAGAGRGKVRKLEPDLCATPVPKAYDGVTYGFAYSDDGGRADVDGYVLTVPGGVLDDPVGQWLSITPLPGDDMLGPPRPSADFHIFGDWANGVDKVFVTVPDASYAEIMDDANENPSDPWLRGLIHYTDETKTAGELVVGGDILFDESAKTVTGVVTDLSPLDWVTHKANWLIEPAYGLLGTAFPGPSCGSDWTEVSGTNYWEKDGNKFLIFGNWMDLPGNEVPVGGFPIKHCIGSAGSDGKITFRNSTGSVMQMDLESGTPTLNSPPNIASGLLTPVDYAISTIGVPTNARVLTPGADATAGLPIGTEARVNLASDPARTVVYLALDFAFGKIMDRIAKWPGMATTTNALTAELAGCIYQSLGTLTSAGTPTSFLRQAMNALISCFQYDTIYKRVIEKLADLAGSYTDSHPVLVQLLNLREFAKILKVGGMAVGAIDGFTWSGDNPIVFGIQEAKPTVDSQGRRVPDHCVTLDDDGLRWTIDNGCQNAYYYNGSNPPPGSGGGDTGLRPAVILRDGDRTSLYYYPVPEDGLGAEIRPIDTGGLYLCLTRHYPIDWISRDGQYGGQNPTIYLTPPTCDSSLAPTRVLTNEALQNTSYLLRETSGRAWIYSNDGSRREIPSGEEFNCAVDAEPGYIDFLVWDQVPFDTINAEWPTVKPYNISFCPGF